ATGDRGNSESHKRHEASAAHDQRIVAKDDHGGPEGDRGVPRLDDVDSRRHRGRVRSSHVGHVTRRGSGSEVELYERVPEIVVGDVGDSRLRYPTFRGYGAQGRADLEASPSA